MAINLSGKVSKRDVDKTKKVLNPSEYEDGFEPEGYGKPEDVFWDTDGFDHLFDGDEDTGKSSKRSNSSSSFFSDFDDGDSNSNTSVSTGLQRQNIGSQQFMPAGYAQNTQQVNEEPLDKAIDASIKGVSAIAHVLKDTALSIKGKNLDDLGYYSRNLTITGIVVFVVSLVVSIIFTVLKVSGLGITGLFADLAGAGIICVGTGVVLFTTSMIGLQFTKGSASSNKNKTAVDSRIVYNETSSWEDSDDEDDESDDIFDKLFNDDEEDDDWGNSNFHYSGAYQVPP